MSFTVPGRAPRPAVPARPPFGAVPIVPRSTAGRATLERETTRWLAELPANVRPTELALRLPHIANRLAQSWLTPEKCSSYFDELMRDRRGGRKGFPARIAFELTALKKHHDALVRRALRNSWNDPIVR